MTKVDTESIEQLDFTSIQPCDSMGHNKDHVPEEAAAYYVRWACPFCTFSVEFFLCHSGWDLAGRVELGCGRCASKRLFGRNECLTILYSL